MTLSRYVAIALSILATDVKMKVLISSTVLLIHEDYSHLYFWLESCFSLKKNLQLSQQLVQLVQDLQASH